MKVATGPGKLSSRNGWPASVPGQGDIARDLHPDDADLHPDDAEFFKVAP